MHVMRLAINLSVCLHVLACVLCTPCAMHASGAKHSHHSAREAWTGSMGRWIQSRQEAEAEAQPDAQ